MKKTFTLTKEQHKPTRCLALILCLAFIISVLAPTMLAYKQDGPYYVASSEEHDYTLPAGQTMSLFDKDGMYSNFTYAYDSETGSYILDEEGKPILIRADIGKDFLYVVKSGDRYYTFGDVSSSNSLRTSIPAVDITDWVDAANGVVNVPPDTTGVMFLSYTKWETDNYGLTANGHDRLFGYEYKSIYDKENNNKFLRYDVYFKFENTQKNRSGDSFRWYNEDDTDADGYLTGFTSYWDRELRYHIYPILRENSDGMKYFGITSKHIDETMTENARLYATNCRHESTVDYLPYDAPTCMDRGSEEFWYCHGCEEYFSDAAMTQFMGVDHPQIEALGHDYGEEKCNNCGREVPVYKKVSTKAELDALSDEASYIVVAEYNGQTYVLGNDQKPEEEFENPYLDWGDVLAVPVIKNADGSISVKGTKAVEFQMTPQYTSEQIDAILADEWIAESGTTRVDVEAVYQFITPGRFFRAAGMNKTVRNYKQMLWDEGDNRVWKVYFYNELKDLNLDSMQRGFVESVAFEDTNLVLAYHWPSADPKEHIPFAQSVRLRDFGDTVSFIAGSNYNMEGFNTTLYIDEDGNQKSNDKQAAVYLYASEAQFDHTHSFGPWQDNLNGFHIRYCTVSGCTARETGVHMWSDMTSDNDKTHSHICSVCNITVAEAHELSTNKVDEKTHETTCRMCNYAVTDNHNISIFSAWGSETHSCNCSGCTHWYEESCSFTIPIDKIETETETKIVYQCEKCANTKTVIAETTNNLSSTGTTGIAMNIPSYVQGSPDNAIVPVGTVFTVAETNEQPAEETKGNIDAAVNEHVGEDVQVNVIVTYNMALTFNDASIQPGGEVEVTIPKPASEENYDGYVVVYTSADGEATTHETTDNGDDTLTFTTNHFSKYSLVGYKAGTPHTHSWSNTWESDGTHHWRECSCGAKSDNAEHVYTDDQDTTCNTCGYTRIVIKKITEIRLGELPKISTSTNVSELRTAIRNDFASKTGLASPSTTYPYIFFSGSGHQTSFSSFEEGKTYYAYWVINAAEGYELSDSISIYVGSNKLNKINSGALYTGYQAGTNSNTGKKTIWVMVDLQWVELSRYVQSKNPLNMINVDKCT